MKRMKQSGCKDQEELDEDNEELFAELGIDPAHQHVDRTDSRRMTEDRDKWRNYVHGVANPRIEDG